MGEDMGVDVSTIRKHPKFRFVNASGGTRGVVAVLRSLPQTELQMLYWILIQSYVEWVEVNTYTDPQTMPDLSIKYFGTPTATDWWEADTLAGCVRLAMENMQ